MVVVCDTYNYDDYPVYVGGTGLTEDRPLDEVIAEYDNKNMQRIMEVYNLSMDKESQMSEHRAFHY